VQVAVAKPTRHLSLVMPGALGPVDLLAPAQLPPLPHLARLLARGQSSPFSADTLEQALFRLFDHESNELPVAPLSYALETGSESGEWCMRADPVLLVPGQTSLMLMASGRELQIAPDEAQTVVSDLNKHFSELQLRFEAPTPQHWYVFGPMEAVETTPLSRVRGRSVTGRLPQGADGVRWNGVLAELQMLLHDHPVNRARVERGAPQLNSVWFWGAGRLPQLDRGDWTRIWSGRSLPMALAHACGIKRADRPVDAGEWLSQAEPGRHLLVLDELEPYLPDIPQEAWGRVMARLERDWWQGLWQALRRGELDSLCLYPLDGRAICIDRKGVRRWWRRPASWASLLKAADYGQTD